MLCTPSRRGLLKSTGAVFASAASCRMMNVYVVAFESVLSSQLDCVLVHALAAMKTNLLVHELSVAFTLIT